MHFINHLPKEFYQLVKRKPKELSPEGKGRLQTMIDLEALREAGWKVERVCLMLEMHAVQIDYIQPGKPAQN
jgi:hypothetical protein